ncbi:hypothetical protein EDC39_101469 [Geothermobacter ehrlichii]|uniref:Uncharacterized protein n=1 Tax=Geothermobacter ehrlichii TaxID=213224 RepID=A0A5D3WMS3_9BACT|nr:DNA gyrase inhibitor YacG [Geothermobacter ehrlichii]TYP00303.1 hypothetical protein EDC39_101469 [Geothermobacter ehrlichii]
MAEAKKRLMAVRCPSCGKKTSYYGNPQRPFCSERCRNLDLGAWADESYRIPGPPTLVDEETGN